jgi:hypothetical protein
MAGCPVKLRWAIENFPICFLPSIDAAFRRQSELHSKFTKLADHKPTQASVINCVKQLLSIPKLDEEKKKSQLQDIWNRLKASVGSRGLSQPSEASQLQLVVINLFVVIFLSYFRQNG